MRKYSFHPDSLAAIAGQLFKNPQFADAVVAVGVMQNGLWTLTEEQFQGIAKRLSLSPLTVAPPATRAQPPAPTHGPGTELKKLLKKIGITATPNCSCNARARRMDEEEARHPGWCEAHLDEIVGWLREEATKRGLPFVDMAGRVLVKRAIKNAQRAKAST